MTTAQIIFAIALGVVAAIIVGFACYVFASVLSTNKWTGTSKRRDGKPTGGSLLDEVAK